MAKETKLPGKTPWAGRRRPMTRQSGYSVTSEVRLKKEMIETIRLTRGQVVAVEIEIDKVKKGDRLGFGGWFTASGPVEVGRKDLISDWVCNIPLNGEWGKFGSQWVSTVAGKISLDIQFKATKALEFALYDVAGGHVEHDGITEARPELLKNMWTFAPEGNIFPHADGIVYVVEPDTTSGKKVEITLKSCNRCGRFLPVNMAPNERVTLSFSNHCIARAPCRHSSFGRIQDFQKSDLTFQMEYGFQLECRFCKKFFVNAPLNPQRTAGQMKEDGARRRAFEVLLECLNQGSPQLEYKNRTGRDLAADIYEKFDGKCFKCKKSLKSIRKMHLDHTRPLALLWPLDDYATALCSDHNAEKRARMPSDYYSPNELRELAKITGLQLECLRDPSPNVKAIKLLGKRLDWFFDEFIPSGELNKVREGKATAELLVKALQKAVNCVPGGAPYDLVAEARHRGIG